jgi:hypothetical protein
LLNGEAIGHETTRQYKSNGELNAVIGEHDFDLLANGFDELLKECSRRGRIGFVKGSNKGDLRRPIDRDKQMELARFGLQQCR